MRRSSILASGFIMAAAIGWTLSLSFGTGPLGEEPALLLGLDLLTVATILAVGLVLSNGVWARRSALVLLAFLATLAFFQTPDAWWCLALFATIVAAVLVAGPWLGRRNAPSAAPPPVRATILALGLPVIPGLVAVCGPTDVTTAGWLLAGLAMVCAWGYARALPAFVWVARLLLPAFGIIAAAGLGWLGGTIVGLAVGALTVLAWSREAMVAVLPPAARRAVPIPIPTELVPQDVLDAAGFDTPGRRRADS